MSRKKHEQIPDFLIIGAGKSGTTSLDNYLKQHPQLFVPILKEPNFFGYEKMTEESFDGNTEEILHFKNSITHLPAYLDLFKDAKPGQLKGETSNTYLYHTDAPERIHYYNPDMKLIAVLRQPAGRLYSRYLHLARENRVPTKSFSDCLDKSTIWWQRNDLIKEGLYYKNISRFFELFPPENIRVYLYEDFNSKPEEVLSDLYAFLGVDQKFTTDLTVKYNQSGFIKNKFLDKLYGQKGILNKTAKALLPMNLIQKLKNNVSVQRKINTLRGRNLSKPKMDPEVRYKLTNEVYGDDIQKLGKLLNKDLRHWLK